MRLLAGIVVAAAAFGAEWPSFRGENGFGVAEATGLPVEFGPRKNVVWRTALPGGTSSPILSGERIFLTGHEKDDLITLALDRASGKVLWRKTIRRSRSEQLHKLNSPASSTPVTDGKNIYVFFGDFGLVSYGVDGNERWRVQLGPFTNLHGMGASPILAGDKLIVLCDQDTDAYLAAFDTRDGKELWRTARPAVVHGHATPTLFQARGDELQVVVPGSYLLASYSAVTGKELWTVRGLSWQIKNTAITKDGTIYVTGWAPGADAGQSQPLPAFEVAAREIDANGDNKLAPEEINPSKYKHPGSWRAVDLDNDGFISPRDWTFYRARRASRNVTLAVRPGNARGDLTDTHVLWRNEKFVPQVSSPLLYEGTLYTIKDGGILTSIDPSSGAIHKSARIPGAIDSYYSSPVAGDGKIYIGSEKGLVSVIKPGAQWEPLAVHDFEENIYASPAIAGDRIYLRTASALYSLASSPGTTAQAPPPEKR